MYNARRKNSFIKYNSNGNQIVDKNIVSIFNSTATYEAYYGKDICLFSSDELREMMVGMKRTDASSLYRIQAILDKYFKWCETKGYIDNVIDFDEADFSPKRLVYVDDYYDDISIYHFRNKLQNACDRVLVAAPFYGASKSDSFADLRSMCESNVDLEKGVIQFPNREVSAPRWLLEDIVEACKTYVYFDVNGREYNLIGDGVIKFYDVSNNKGGDVKRQVANKFHKVFKKQLGVNDITYTKIFRSGVLYYSIDVMLENDVSKVSKLWSLDEFQETVVKRFQIGRNRFYTVYVPIIEDYSQRMLNYD